MIDPPEAAPGSAEVTVLQVLPALVTGGVERATIDVAAAIIAAGGRAVVASAGGPMVHELTRVGATHVELPLAAKRPWTMWANVGRLEKLIRAEGVDIIHARSRAPAWSAWLAARRAGRPFVTTFHGTYNFRSRLKRWYNSIMTRGDLVIANSTFIGRHIVEHYAIDPRRIRVIPRGIDLAVFDPAAVTQERVIALTRSWRLPDGVPLIMLPGRLTRWKGHLVLIAAMDILAREFGRQFHCVLVGHEGGAAAYRAEIEKRVGELGLGGMVRLVGDCRDMPAAYRLADVVVSASTDPEAFGRVAAEASAMGRPVIATDHGGARETVVHGDTGWLVPPGDPMALARAIDEAIALRPDDRAHIARRGRAYISTHFSKAGMTDATLEVYAELLNRAR